MDLIAARFWMSVGIALLAAAATVAGLLQPDLYRNDTDFYAAGFRGQDAVTLLLGVPLLAVTAILYRGGSLKAGLVLTAVLGWFLYGYASMALGASYNEAFLIYIALFSLSFFAVALSLSAQDLRAALEGTLPHLPRRGPAIFMFAGGAVTLFVWGSPLVASLLSGKPPEFLEGYTTMVTYALDLAIITPSTIVAGVLILKRNVLGYLIALPLFGIIIMLLPVITLSTIYQLEAGITFSPGEVIGPIMGFAVLGAVAVWLLLRIVTARPSDG